MAELLKDRARKPVIHDGMVFPRKSVVDGVMMYGFTISESWVDGQRQQAFDLLLTEKEFLKTVSENLRDIALARPSTPRGET